MENERPDSSIMKQLLMVDDFTQMSAIDKFMEAESPNKIHTQSTNILQNVTA